MIGVLKKMFHNLKLYLSYMEKITLGVWGLTVMDLLAIIDLDFFSDDVFRFYFSVIGFIYLLIQLPFKVIELNSKRKFNRIQNDLKSLELSDKIKQAEEIEKAQKILSRYDETYKIFNSNHQKKSGK